MIEIELKVFIDVLKANNLTKAKLANGKARVWLDLDKLTIVYNGQETPPKTAVIKLWRLSLLFILS